MTGFGANIAFSPLIPWLFLYVFAGIALIGVVAGFWLRARGVIWRLGAVALLWLILANPSLVIENREPIRDVVVVVVDESQSQSIEDRDKRLKAALENIRAQVKRQADLDIRIVRAGNDATIDGTHLFGALERVLADVPRKRLAGVILLTDGQVHDAPKAGRMIRGIGPVHVLLTGRKDEKDRRLVIVSKPAFGLMRKPLTMKVRVDDNSVPPGTRVRVTIKRDGKPWRSGSVPVGRVSTLRFELDHPRTTFFELEVERGPSELTLENNRKVVAVNGIRDRLRVLLVSGHPHPGERAWRNILKADPGVDLVHFTILRPPEKRDMTPVNELALISFPVRELFQEKLGKFHLIIFDRYRRRGVINSFYLANIARYVRRGGALLVAAGPDYAGALSLNHTVIGPLLPAVPTGQIYIEGYRAVRTKIGRRHPVTARLPGSGTGDNPWGRFFRHIDAQVRTGHVVLNGVRGRPLLILNRVGKGRVAQLLTDQAWLWDRGYEGGGPQAELLRRLGHWLMKEPELEEELLAAVIRAKRLTVRRRSLSDANKPVIVIGPDGKKITLKMQPRSDNEKGAGGEWTGTLLLKRPGLYRITDGKLNTMIAIGSLNAKEMARVRTTPKPLEPTIAANTGSVTWLNDSGTPSIRRVAADDRVTGSGGLGGGRWIGLRRNGDYVVSGIQEVPLLLGLIALLIALFPLILAWRREGK